MIMEKVNKAIRTGDGFINLVSKIGIGANNQFSQGTYRRPTLSRHREKLSTMHRTSWLTGASIDTIAEDMVKKGIDIKGAIEPDDITLIQNNFSELGVWTKLKENIQWGRLFGGSIAVIEIKGQAPQTELNIDTIAKDQFKGLIIYSRYELQPSLTDLVKDGGIYHGLPKYYQVINSNIKYHYTRVIRHIGTKLEKEQQFEEEFWGGSLMERLESVILGFDTTSASINSLVGKAYLRTVGVENLRDILAAGGDAESSLIKMFHYMGYLQSTEGVTLLDKEDTFNTQKYAFAGLPDILMTNGRQIAGACKTPLIKLFGQSPDGMNATGESDLTLYNDGILTEQETHLREPLTRLLKIMYWSTFGKRPPDDLFFSFTSMKEMDEKEKAEIAIAKTNAIVTAFDSGVIDEGIALKELKQLAEVTGMFDNITDAMIKIIESKIPDAPAMPKWDKPEAPEILEADPKLEPKKKKMVDWLFGDAKKKCKGCGENNLTSNPYDQKYSYCQECFPYYKNVCEECGNIYEANKDKCPKCKNPLIKD